MKSPILSVVIPTYNEEKDIDFCLKSLVKQSYKNIEIIVVDDGSTDNTREIVRKHKKVKLLKGEHKGPGFSRNLGVEKAKGEIIIFIDSDMTFDKDYLKNLTKPIIEDYSVIGTTHDYEIVENTNNIWSKCWGKVRVSPKNAKEVKIFRAIRRKEFIKMGCFDPQYGYADDQTFWFKFQVKPVVANNTICYHRNPETLKAVYKQSRWIGASIDNSLLRIKIISYIIPILLIILSPILIVLLTIKKVVKQNEYSIIGYMLIFMCARYFGTITGLMRKIYVGVNVR